MSGALTPLPSPTREYRQQAVDVLRKALAKAEAGDMKSVIVIAELDGSTEFTYSSTPDNFRLAGMLTHVTQSVLARMEIAP